VFFERLVAPEHSGFLVAGLRLAVDLDRCPAGHPQRERPREAADVDELHVEARTRPQPPLQSVSTSSVAPIAPVTGEEAGALIFV
jgi:hypothetical protein